MGIYEYSYGGPEWATVFYESDYTITYTTTSGEVVRVPRPPKWQKEPELQAGDPSVLDDFLGGFANAQK